MAGDFGDNEGVTLRIGDQVRLPSTDNSGIVTALFVGPDGAGYATVSVYGCNWRGGWEDVDLRCGDLTRA